MRLDNYDKLPEGLKQYLSYYGWHFNKKMCDYAVKHMKKSSGNPIIYTKESLEQLLQRNNINLQTDYIYDAVYVANMCSFDFLNSSIPDERHLAKYVKDVIEDYDAYEGMVFTRYYADIIGSGKSIEWSDML